jgi:hypothetical protein
MRTLIALCATVAAVALAFLALTGAAGAGGWATVGFEPLPDGTSAGGTWHPTITIKQHGVTPLGGLSPVVTIEDASTGGTQTFMATETSRIGTYEADVVFPSAGDWRVAIDSGFGDSRVTYGPLAIDAPSGGSPGSGSFPVAPVAAVLGALALAAAALLGARRLRRLTPASR